MRMETTRSVRHPGIGLKLLVICAVCLCWLGLFSMDAHAASYTTINVTAEDIADQGAVKALQAAIDEAEASATSSKPYKIVVEAGSYAFNGGIEISGSYIYLDLTGVTFTQESGSIKNMIRIGAEDDTGYSNKNITIDGGTWNANGNENTLMKIAHAADITIENATFKNVSNSHLVEIAGVDGITITGCSFSDQSLEGTDSVTLSYEAIQLDILTTDHITGYTDEDLQLKDVVITGCTFDNVPRGIGSHTAVLNEPIDGLTITNNTFTNISSCAIQLMNIQDAEISGNTMTNVPRGIYIYSYQQINGIYLGTYLSSDSTTKTTYQTPTSSNIVISDNTMTIKGTDSYATYQTCGIFLCGFELSSSTKGGGGTIPAGNYYLTGVTVKDNTITTVGHGIRLADTYNTTITGNTVTCTASSSSNSYYGISSYDESLKNVITYNTVDGFYRGIYINDGSSATEITGNTITNASNNAIMIQDSTVTKIKENTISSTKNNGIYVYDDAKVTYIKANTIKSSGKYGIGVEDATATYIQKNTISGFKRGIYLCDESSSSEITGNIISNISNNAIMIQDSTVTKIKENTISSTDNNGIYVYDGAKVTYVKANTIKSPGKYGISVEDATASKIQKNTITSPKNHGIVALNDGKISEISGNTIKNGSKRAISISSLECNLVISSNTVSKCGSDYMIYLNPKTTDYKITVKSNTITGKSKSVIGIRADSGTIVIQSNTIKSCSYPVKLLSVVKGTIYKNTLSGNKTNKYLIGSKTYANLSTTTVTVDKKTKSSIKLSWTKCSGTGYQIYRATSKSGDYTKVKTVTSSSTLTYTNKSLKKSKTYYYKIRAYRKVGNTIIYGSFSTVTSAKTTSK